jgi:NAD(P)-dependent dehydrogenase (short-subunit alcohol dehydrogenase family)
MPEQDEKRRAALVVGGTGAVGSAVCRLLSADGNDLTFSYRSNSEAADVLCRELRAAGRQVEAHAVDLTDTAAAAAFVKDAGERFGGIDTVVHAGGPHVPQIRISKIEPATFRHQLELEAVAFYNVVHPALPYLRASRGSIVAVTTVALRRFPLRDGLSPSAKAGIEALVRAIAAEEGRFGVRANCVGPGLLWDGMAQRLRESGDFDDNAQDAALREIPLRRFGRANEVAEAVAFLASDRASYISGQSLDVDGGYSL